MPTPLHLKTPIAAWIIRERRRLGLKPKDVADRLTAMGYQVSEATVKVWESNKDRRPSPFNVEGLERLFESRAPAVQPIAVGEAAAVIAALRDQILTITTLVEEMRLGRAQQEESTEVVLRALASLAGGRAPLGTPAGSGLSEASGRR